MIHLHKIDVLVSRKHRLQMTTFFKTGDLVFFDAVGRASRFSRLSVLGLIVGYSSLGMVSSRRFRVLAETGDVVTVHPENIRRCQ